MKYSTKLSVAGVAGAVLACLPCCVPLLAPLLAWLGVSTLGVAAVGWHAGVAGALMLATAGILFLRHRAAARRAASSGCGCDTSCEPNCSAGKQGE